MLGSLILYLKGMRIMMFQLSGFYCSLRSEDAACDSLLGLLPSIPSLIALFKNLEVAFKDPDNKDASQGSAFGSPIFENSRRKTPKYPYADPMVLGVAHSMVILIALWVHITTTLRLRHASEL